MRTAVRAAWPSLITTYEGRIPHLYLDTKQLVTFGLGNMVDTGAAVTDYGLTRPWRTKAGDLVTEATIKTEYTRIKARADLAPKGGGAYAPIATLTLTGTDIDEALWDTTDTYWAVLAKTLPELEDWPADAQLALLNMAWNLGPAFLGSSWPTFTAAAKAADFAGCAVSCVRAARAPRDYRNRRLFLNAALAIDEKLDLERLWDQALPKE